MSRSFFGPTVQFGPGDIGEPYPEDDEGCPECGAEIYFAGALLSCTECGWDEAEARDEHEAGYP